MSVSFRGTPLLQGSAFLDVGRSNLTPNATFTITKNSRTVTNDQFAAFSTRGKNQLLNLLKRGLVTVQIDGVTKTASDLETIFNAGQGGGNPQPVTPVAWKVLYSVDFTSLSAYSMPPGEHTIDGLKWWTKTGNGAGIAGAIPKIVPGSGLETGQTVAIDGSIGASSCRPFLPFSNIPGYNPASPVCIQFRQRSHVNSFAVCGLASFSANSNPVTNNEYDTRYGLVRPGNPDSNSSTMYLLTRASQDTAGRTVSRLAADSGMSIYLLNASTMVWAAFNWSDQPNPATGLHDSGTGAVIGSGSSVTQDPNLVGFYAGFNGAAGGAFIPSYIQNLKIWQLG